MGIFDSLGDFFSRLWDQLTDFLKKVWDELRPILAIVAVIIALAMAFPVGVIALPGVLAGLSGAMASTPFLAIALGIGTATLLDPEGVQAAIGKIGDTAAAVGKAVGNVIGSTVGGGLDSFTQSTTGKVIVYGGIAILGFWAWGKLKGDRNDQPSGDSGTQVEYYDDYYPEEEAYRPDDEYIEGEFQVT